MQDFILILIILGIVAVALVYIFRQKKSGAKCIGCPASKTCTKCKCYESSK